MYNLYPRDEDLEGELFGKDTRESKEKEVLLEVDSQEDHDAIQLFSDADLGPVVLNTLELVHFERPFALQKYSIPIVLQGRNVVVHAPKECGKTLGLLLPTIAKMTQNPPAPTERIRHPQCLILTPTRDCAIRNQQQARKFSYRSHLRTVCVYGGAEIRQQISQIKEGCHILVATPGRLVDLLEREVVFLGEVRYLIIDEVSRLMDMGFEPQLRRIVKVLPNVGQRQTLMTSTAFTQYEHLFAGDISGNYVMLGAKLGKTVKITQRVIQVEEAQKTEKLIELLGTMQGLTLVFVGRKSVASSLNECLKKVGVSCVTIHGDKTSSERDVALAQFSSEKAKVLVATDIASRGIDIHNITNIVNYDMPTDIEDYVMRMGKTGREEPGTVTSFLNRSNARIAQDLIQLLEDANEPVESFLHQYTNL